MSAFISPLCVSLISFLIILIVATCSPPEPHCLASHMYLRCVFPSLVTCLFATQFFFGLSGFPWHLGLLECVLRLQVPLVFLVWDQQHG